MDTVLQNLDININVKDNNAVSKIMALNNALASLQRRIDGMTSRKFSSTMTNISKKAETTGKNIKKALNVEVPDIKAPDIVKKDPEQSTTGNGISGNTTNVEKQVSAFRKFRASLSATRNTITSLSVVFAQLMGIGKSTVGEATDFIEAVNLFNYSMGSYAEQAGAYAERVQDALGIDISNWMQQQGTLQKMATGFGMTEREAYRLSQTMTNLAYDYASFFNTDFDVSFEKIRSAISGQVRPMRQFGVDLTQASLAQVALNHGIEKSVQDMSQAEKAYLRAIAIQDAAGNVQGDMARTITQPANAMRVLGQLASQAGRAIGFIFLPFLQRIIPVAQAVVIILRNVAQAIASFFGVKIPSFKNITGGLGSSMGDVAKNAGTAGKNLGSAGKSAGKTAKATKKTSDNTKKTAKTVKKIKRELAGFDQLNVLSFSKPADTKSKKPSTPSTGGSGGGGGGGGGGGIGGGGGGIDFFDDLNPYDLFAGAEEKVQKIIEKVKILGKWALGIGKIFLGWKIAKAFMDVLTYGGSFAQGLLGLLYKIGLTIGGFVSKFLPFNVVAESSLAMMASMATAITIIIFRLTSAIKNSKMFREGMKAILNLAKMILKAIARFLIWITKLGESLKLNKEAMDAIKDVIAVIGGLILTVIFPPAGALLLIVEGLIIMIKTIGALMQNSTFVKVLNMIKEILAGIIKDVGKSLANSIKTIVESIREIWKVIKPVAVIVGKIILAVAGGALIGGFILIVKALQLIGKLVAFLAKAVLVVIKGMARLFKVVGAIAKFIAHPFKFFMEMDKKTANKLLTDTKERRKLLQNYLKKNAVLLYQGLKNKVGYWLDEMKKRRKSAQDWISNNKIKLGATVSTGADFIRKQIQKLANKAQRAVRGLKIAIKFAFDLADMGINEIRKRVTRPLGNWLKSKGGVIGKIGGAIANFETGGFPSYGELFLANENGNAEMIGSIGNRPAVANNEQIVSAVANGVTNAMISALRQTSSSGGSSSGEMTINVPVYLDNEVVAKGTVKYINGQIQRYGVSPITG